MRRPSGPRVFGWSATDAGGSPWRFSRPTPVGLRPVGDRFGPEGVGACCRGRAVEAADDRLRGPARPAVAGERGAAAPARVRARPVERGGGKAEALAPEAVRAADRFAGPARA